MTIVRDFAENIQSDGDLIVSGDLQVSGTTTTVNSTTVEIGDKNIVLGATATANSQNDGGGISILLPDASPDEFATFTHTGTTWNLNDSLSLDDGNLNLVSGVVQIGGTTVIDASRNLTNIGTISSGAITSTGKLTLNDASVGGWIQSNTSIRLDIDNDNNQTDRAFVVSKNNGATDLLTILEDASATFAGTISSGTQTLVADTSVIQSIRNPNTAWEQYALTRYGTESANFRYMDFGYYRGTTEATRGLVIKSQANATLFTFLDSGEFQVGTTTVIDSSRNYVGPYFNSSSSVNFSGEGGLQIDSGYRLGFNENGVRSWNMKATGGSLVVTSGDGNGGFDISGPELKIGGQTVIDSSRNITAGNIISGSGATGSVIGGIRAYGSSNAYMCAGDADGKTAFFGVDNSGYAMFGALTNHDAVIRANNNEYLRVKTNSNVNVVSGALEIGGTPVIDSSRNLVNLNGSIKSDTVFAFLTNADAAQDVRTKSVFAGTSYGDTPPAGSFNATNTYELNGTTVIDSSRNLTNIGTISSGTITSTGDIVASKFEFNSNSIFNGRIGDTSGSFFYTGTTVPTSFWDINNLGNGNLIMTLSDAGAMSIAGTLTQSASDERLKENIQPITNALEKLNLLRGVEFDWKDNIEGFSPEQKHETGVIAQEVEKVMPDAVVPAPFNKEYKTVHKDKLIALLIEAVKELQQEVELLKNNS